MKDGFLSTSFSLHICISNKNNEIKNKQKKTLRARHDRLIDILHVQDTKWELVLIPPAALPIQLPACVLGKQERMTQSLGTLHLCEGPRRNSWVLALDWLSFSTSNH